MWAPLLSQGGWRLLVALLVLLGCAWARLFVDYATYLRPAIRPPLGVQIANLMPEPVVVCWSRMGSGDPVLDRLASVAHTHGGLGTQTNSYEQKSHDLFGPPSLEWDTARTDTGLRLVLENAQTIPHCRELPPGMQAGMNSVPGHVFGVYTRFSESGEHSRADEHSGSGSGQGRPTLRLLDVLRMRSDQARYAVPTHLWAAQGAPEPETSVFETVEIFLRAWLTNPAPVRWLDSHREEICVALAVWVIVHCLVVQAWPAWRQEKRVLAQVERVNSGASNRVNRVNGKKGGEDENYGRHDNEEENKNTNSKNKKANNNKDKSKQANRGDNKSVENTSGDNNSHNNNHRNPSNTKNSHKNHNTHQNNSKTSVRNASTSSLRWIELCKGLATLVMVLDHIGRTLGRDHRHWMTFPAQFGGALWFYYLSGGHAAVAGLRMWASGNASDPSQNDVSRNDDTCKKSVSYKNVSQQDAYACKDEFKQASQHNSSQNASKKTTSKSLPHNDACHKYDSSHNDDVSNTTDTYHNVSLDTFATTTQHLRSQASAAAWRRRTAVRTAVLAALFLVMHRVVMPTGSYVQVWTLLTLAVSRMAMLHVQSGWAACVWLCTGQWPITGTKTTTTTTTTKISSTSSSKSSESSPISPSPSKSSSTPSKLSQSSYTLTHICVAMILAGLLYLLEPFLGYEGLRLAYGSRFVFFALAGFVVELRNHNSANSNSNSNTSRNGNISDTSNDFNKSHTNKAHAKHQRNSAAAGGVRSQPLDALETITTTTNSKKLTATTLDACTTTTSTKRDIAAASTDVTTTPTKLFTLLPNTPGPRLTSVLWLACAWLLAVYLNQQNVVFPNRRFELLFFVGCLGNLVGLSVTVWAMHAYQATRAVRGVSLGLPGSAWIVKLVKWAGAHSLTVYFGHLAVLWALEWWLYLRPEMKI